MAKKIAFLIIFLITYNAFAKEKEILKEPSSFPPLITTRTLVLDKFSAVDIDGDVDVDLHTGYKDPKMIMKGHVMDLAYLDSYVLNQTLFIRLGKGYPHYGKIKLDIRTKNLNSIKYKGIGNITGTKLHSSLLSININNQGNTKLKGYLGIKSLILDGKGNVDISGVDTKGMSINIRGDARVHLQGMGGITTMHLDNNSWLEMYWVNARDLHIWLRDHAYLKLAGIAIHLYADLCQQARFDGRYLRAKSSFVKTHDKSFAEISTTVKQHTLAQDNSDIFYFELPNMQANFMSHNGSVLDMRDINNPFFEEPTRYNKDPLY